MDRSELLARIPLFESLTREDLVTLAQGLEEKRLDAGQTVFKQGDAGGELYIINDGAVDIAVGAVPYAVCVASLFSGQYFGELSLFDGMPRSATALTTKPTHFFVLDRDDLVRFIRVSPDGAMRILSEMSNRMRKTNELMTNQVSRNVIEEHEEKLSFGDRISDRMASFGGSWAFIFCFVGIVGLWLLVNILVPYDRPGFMLLNLILAVVAAGQAPVIMMSQNRQETKSKLLAENDYQVNLKNELGIANLQKGQAEMLQRMLLLEKQLETVARGVGGTAAVAK